MNFHQKRKNKQVDEIKSGGTDDVPPALCPRAAHVEVTGETGSRSFFQTRWVRPAMGNDPILTWEAA